jgi:hypothetical protein
MAPIAPVPQSGPVSPLRWTIAGTNISKSDRVTPFARRRDRRDTDTHGGTPRRMRINLRMLSPGGSSIEPSVSSSYGIDMIALTGMSRTWSKIEIPLSGKSARPGRGRVSKGRG